MSMLLIWKDSDDLRKSAIVSPPISGSFLAKGSINQGRGKYLNGCSVSKIFRDVKCKNGVLESKVEEDCENTDRLCLVGPLPSGAYPNISSKPEGS